MRPTAVMMLAMALAGLSAGRGSAHIATLGSAAAASGPYYGAALDPDALDERPYRELAEASQARDYASVVAACRATPRCVGITTWGLTDDRSWIPSFFSGYGAALPFDADDRPKPAAAAMIRAFAEH